MKKPAFAFVALLLIPFFPGKSHADTSVVISSNSSGSDSSFEINNTIHSSTSQISSSNSHITVYMNNNGKVQTYNSDSPGGVHMQSDDANSKVDIENNINGNSSASTSPIPTITVPIPTITITIPTINEQKIKDDLDKEKAKIEEKAKQLQAQNENLLHKIESFLKNLFSFHFSL